jgi:hypothetical protein
MDGKRSVNSEFKSREIKSLNLGGDDDALLLLLSSTTSTFIRLEMKRQCKHGDVYGFYVLGITTTSRGESNWIKR